MSDTLRDILRDMVPNRRDALCMCIGPLWLLILFVCTVLFA